MNFDSLATSSAHVDGVRFVMIAGVEDGLGERRGRELLVHERSRESEGREWAYRSVLDRGLRAVFEEDEVEEDGISWTGRGGCTVDEDDGFGFAVDLVDATERLNAAIAALLLADTSFVRLCALVFRLGVTVVTGFGGACIVVVLQV